MIALLDKEREAILQEWSNDPECPPREHEPRECKGRCDGYCIVHNLLSNIAHQIEKTWQTKKQLHH